MPRTLGFAGEAMMVSMGTPEEKALAKAIHRLDTELEKRQPGEPRRFEPGAKERKRQRQSEAARALWADPVYRERQLEAQRLALARKSSEVRGALADLL